MWNWIYFRFVNIIYDSKIFNLHVEPINIRVYVHACQYKKAIFFSLNWKSQFKTNTLVFKNTIYIHDNECNDSLF